MILNYYKESDNINTAIIGLHGWTGSEHSMVPVAKSMKIPNAKWYIPRAPYNASSGKGYTWFSGSPENGWKTKKSFNLMDKLFNKIIDDGFLPNKIILLGFSESIPAMAIEGTAAVGAVAIGDCLLYKSPSPRD